jgi:glycosyltransferase involved in cell wall biosynthesis
VFGKRGKGAARRRTGRDSASGAPRKPRYVVIGSRGYPSTYGGYETFVRRFAPWLAERADVTVYGRTTRLRFEREEIDGVTVVHTPGVDSKSIGTLTHGLTACLHAAFTRPDAALVLNVANGFFVFLLRLRGIRTIVNVDGLEWERSKWNSFGKRVFRGGARLCAKTADELIVDAKALGDIWQREFHAPTTYIAYGADIPTSRNEQLVSSIGLTPGTYILIVARFAPENNVDLFLDAMESLGFPYPLVVVGSANYNNPTEKRLSGLAGRHANVRWLGHVADQALLSALWCNCALYLHGHTVGGTNPALLQALASAAPILAVDNVYSREVLASAGSVVTPERTAVAQQITTLMEDGSLRAQLGQRGPDRIRDHYLWEDVCQTYLRSLQGPQ